MVRVKAPFGGVTAEMLDALGVASDRFAPLRKGHVTTRENIQYHHIRLEDTPKMMRVLAEAGMSTREACGNTVRNVTGCPKAGVCADEVFDVTPYAAAYARFFVRHPVTQAMPRKVKSAFSGCEADCAITPIHDMGFVPKIEGGRKGFKMVTGGGTSIMPRIAPVLYDFVPVEEYLKVSEAVFRIFDRTNELRRNKMKARIKFYIDRIGIDEFRKEVEEELRQPWAQRGYRPDGPAVRRGRISGRALSTSGRLQPQRALARVQPVGRVERGAAEAGPVHGRDGQAPAGRHFGGAVPRPGGAFAQVRRGQGAAHAPAEHRVQVGARGGAVRVLAGAEPDRFRRGGRGRDHGRGVVPGD